MVTTFLIHLTFFPPFSQYNMLTNYYVFQSNCAKYSIIVNKQLFW